jgi:transposase
VSITLIISLPLAPITSTAPESFWSFAKRQMQKFNGLRTEKFLLHLKESEFRFNHRRDDLYQVLLRTLRNHPL